MDSRATECEIQELLNELENKCKIQELENKLLHPTTEPVSLPLGFSRSTTDDFCDMRELGRGGYGVVYKEMDCRATECEIEELENKLMYPTAEPVSLPLGFLRSITDDFCNERELGRGGYGVVYKGVLPCGLVIAVKKVHDIHLMDEDQFQNEASFLMGTKHPNVVQLLGYCAESCEVMIKLQDGRYIVAEKLTKMLCFEYVCNKSLDKHLSDESSGLEWNMRYEIIKGICSGLNFLHKHNIVHLDLKPQNILMDANMMPKIADFSLSRLLGEQKSHTITVICAGSMGYMAPEYITKGVISKKADIFSLGVIIIEILKGCKDDYPDYYQRTEIDLQHFTEKVLSNWRNRFQTASKYTALELHTHEVKQCIDIALECVDPDKEKRPNISNIIELLNAAEGNYFVENGKERRIQCTACGNFHIWICISRSKTKARFCQDCDQYHQAVNGDGWVETRYSSSVKMEKPRAFVCAESKIFDVSEWAICQGMECKANTHGPTFMVNMVGMDSMHKRSFSSHLDVEMISEDEFELWLRQALASGVFANIPKRRESCLKTVSLQASESTNSGKKSKKDLTATGPNSMMSKFLYYTILIGLLVLCRNYYGCAS